MSMTPGTLLGPYEILAPIGEGGMGDVYKARDTRLDRIVALKTSKTEFSERFEREARAVAALNHSNICTLYDVGPNYLVMEYIEGAPLKGPLPLDQALKYASQICDALDAAHKKGITHRDLKPANILVTKTGLKLLDFGLAKMVQAVGPEDATVRMALTGKNEILGTLYYMSPEQLQANGQEIDARSDIFSFGIVLYEMLTGKRAFDGPSAASVIAGIMERPAPSISEVAPPALDRLLQRCLAKDPDDRWQSARDLKAELEWIANAAPSTTSPPSVVRHGLLPWIAAALLATIAAVFGTGYYRATRPAAPKPLVRLDLDLPVDDTSGARVGPSAILSADGTRLVYISQGKLFTRKLDQTNATELVGTEDAFLPFFSPDGQWVAFFAQRKLKKVSVEGGAPITLCDVSTARGGSWGEDGSIILTVSAFSGLSLIPPTGGAPTSITERTGGEVTHRWPQILPGGKAVLFTTSIYPVGFDRGNIEVVTLKDRRRKTLQQGGTFGRYSPSGHLTYINHGTLFAVPFDLEALEVRGPPVPVLEGVAYSTTSGGPQFEFSQTGMFLYRKGAVSGSGGLGSASIVAWLDRDGKTKPLLEKPGYYTYPNLSPDGARLAFGIDDGSGRDIWIYEWQRKTMTRLSFDSGGLGMNGVWSPDGQYITYQGREGILRTRSDGGGKPELLIQSKNFPTPYSYTPSGRRLAWEERSNDNARLWIMPIESSAGPQGGKPEVLLQSAFAPRFSPDGRWLAYSSNESGTRQVYVRAFPDKGGKWQISNSGGSQPIWSPNGRELFFKSNDDRIMVAAYTTKGDSFLAEQPRVWSEQRLKGNDTTGSVGSYSIAPDGKRFAVLLPVETPEKEQSPSHMVLLENFFDELRRKVPLSK